MSIKQLKKYAKSVNIASEFDEDYLNKVGSQVLEGFREDLNSNQEWLNDVKRVEELASLKSVKKSTPLPNSANVKLPIISKACYEFSSRVGPEIVKDDQVVKTKVMGIDKNDFNKMKGQRAADYMNYQLLVKSSDWENQLNNLLLRLALIGFIVKKTYYDPVRKKLKQILCKPDELIIHADSKSLEEAPRISHILHLRLNDVVEQMNTKEGDVSIFLEEPVKRLQELHKDDSLNKVIDFIEQATYLDLDDDGYLEPYLVTVLKSSGEVFRIVAQYDEDDIYGSSDEVSYVDRDECYEDYHFLPNPKGVFQSVGFGILLLHLTESMNSVMNQLLDSGQLANMKGGYMDARLKEITAGNSLHDPGEFKLTKVTPGLTLKEGILPIDFGEPSSVLFQLLEMLMSVSRDFTSSAEINNGTQSSENAKTGATLAIQEKGEKIFSAINKGIYRALNKEFKHIFEINYKYLDQNEYYNVLQDPLANVKKDFDCSLIHVIPVADPTLSSEQRRMSEAATIQQLMGLPGVDPTKCVKLILDRIPIPGIKGILADGNTKQPPNIELLKLQGDLEEAGQKLNIQGEQLQLSKQELALKIKQAEAVMALQQAQALYYMAQAQSLPVKNQLQDNEIQLDAINKKIDAQLELAGMQHEKDMQANDQAHQQGMQANDQAHEQNMQQQQQQADQQQEAQSNDQAEGASGVAGESGNS